MHLIIFAFFLVNILWTGVRADEQKATEKKPNTVLQCYVCSSAKDPGCSDSLTNNSVSSKKFPHDNVPHRPDYLKTCSQVREQARRDYVNHMGETEDAKWDGTAYGCRKIIQEVEDDVYVVRQCVFTKPDNFEKIDGLKRTGNLGVRMFYYQCYDGSCNAASKISASAAFFFALALPVFLLVVARL